MCRVDALGDTPNLEIGLEYRAKVDARLSQLEGGAALQVAEKAAPTNLAVVVAVTPKSCNADSDSALSSKKAKKDTKEVAEEVAEPAKAAKKNKKEKRKEESEEEEEEPKKEKESKKLKDQE